LTDEEQTFCDVGIYSNLRISRISLSQYSEIARYIV